MAKLRDDGLITTEEFEAKKRELLSPLEVRKSTRRGDRGRR